MKINVEVKTIFKNSTSPLKATVTVIFDDCFVIRNVKLIEGENGQFVALPSYKGRDGSWRSICHPITSEFRETLKTAVIEACQQA